MAPASSASATAAAADGSSAAWSASGTTSSAPAVAPMPVPSASLGTIGASPGGARSGLPATGAAGSAAAVCCSGLGGRPAGLGPPGVEPALLAAPGEPGGRCMTGPAEAGRRSGEGLKAASLWARAWGEAREADQGGERPKGLAAAAWRGVSARGVKLRSGEGSRRVEGGEGGRGVARPSAYLPLERQPAAAAWS